MINSFKINNLKKFSDFNAPKLTKINIILGDECIEKNFLLNSIYCVAKSIEDFNSCETNKLFYTILNKKCFDMLDIKLDDLVYTSDKYNNINLFNMDIDGIEYNISNNKRKKIDKKYNTSKFNFIPISLGSFMKSSAEIIQRNIKIAILNNLKKNNQLDKDSTIFINNIENNLHPKIICYFIDELISTDAQIFLTTNSYIVLKKFFVEALKLGAGVVTIINLDEDKYTINDLYEGIPDNSIIDTIIHLYSQEVENSI